MTLALLWSLMGTLYLYALAVGWERRPDEPPWVGVVVSFGTVYILFYFGGSLVQYLDK